jgi:hypothetical protein
MPQPLFRCEFGGSEQSLRIGRSFAIALDDFENRRSNARRGMINS